MEVLTNNTLIPVGLAIVVIGGSAGWLTKLQFSVSQIKKEMLDLFVWRKEKDNQLMSLNGRLIKIETQLENVINLLADMNRQMAKMLEK